MASIEEIRATRLQKLAKLKEMGINPYPISVGHEFTLEEAIAKFETLLKRKKPVTLVGRVMSIRPHGGLVFFSFNDGTASFQGLLKKDETEEADFNLFSETVDAGDFVEVTGSFFLTKRNEKTIQVLNWKMISKALRQLPEKWHGLQDVEERFRHRYLDVLMSPEVKARFVTRSRTVSLLREFYDKRGYIEVETPRLQSVAGGATALPFKTHHNALDTDFYLTIAQELFLKQLLVGGFTKVYEIGRKFRNEGIDVTHNPEFTMLESQEAYADAKDQMTFVEDLIKFLVKELFGNLEFLRENQKIDFSAKFSVITFFDLLKRYALISNPESITHEELLLHANRLGVKVEPNELAEKIMDGIYKKVCRNKLIQPTFIVDYPVAFNPFAKRKESNSALIDRFQLVISGLEIVNAFSELNDPLDQKERYLAEDEKKKKGESDISPSDKEYLEAMEYGMPPNGGIGIGIDRLAMLFTDTHNIREVILFPTLRPKK